MGHHQEADRIKTEFAPQADMLFGDVGLGAMRGHMDAPCPAIGGHPQFIQCADARDVKDRNCRILHDLGNCRNILAICMQAAPVVERRSPQPVTMSDLDQGHSGIVESRSDVDHLVQGDLMAHRMHAIAQAHVMQLQFAASDLIIQRHYAFSITGSSSSWPSRMS